MKIGSLIEMSQRFDVKTFQTADGKWDACKLNKDLMLPLKSHLKVENTLILS